MIYVLSMIFLLLFLAQVIALGSAKNLKTERYGDDTGTWTELKDYPYTYYPDVEEDMGYISDYAAVYHSGAFYFFGGKGTSIIARLDEVNFKWSLVGKLKRHTTGHGVIFNGSTFLVIGGYNIENCVLDGAVMTCTEQNALMTGNDFNPHLFLTTSTYGDDC